MGSNYLASSITILEQQSGPQFIFGLDNLYRHEVCLWFAKQFGSLTGLGLVYVWADFTRAQTYVGWENRGIPFVKTVITYCLPAHKSTGILQASVYRMLEASFVLDSK